MSTVFSEGEYDDDIADEEYIAALEQVTSLSQTQPSTQRTIERELDVADSTKLTQLTRSSVSNIQLQHDHSRTGSRHDLHAVCHQTTLWSSDFVQRSSEPSQKSSTKAYRVDSLREKPTHHELDLEALKTWVYPKNLGPLRDYQFSIVKNSLFNNTLVALPTGLGKTFIAATVMLNFYRWTKSAKIIFVAPTKPLVAQQVDACYNIVGIPRSETTLLTGEIPPLSRVDEWESKRVFFMTPQTLLNDLSHGYADPKSIALIVIDEAHRAVGEYAYAKVAKSIHRFSESFRVLALTATPGSKIETVQEVIDNLGISHCEIRTEDSIDIRQYVHQRNVESIILDPSDEMNLVSELFTAALKPLTDKLSSQNIFYGRNPMALTLYGLMQSQKEWFATRGRQANQGVQFMMRAVFSVLTSIAHSIKLLQFHGIKPFFANLQDFRSEQEGKGEKGSKYKRQLIEHSSFQEMMSKIASWLKKGGFVGHPKLVTLTQRIMNHFVDRERDAATRVIVFSEYRDSAEEIVRMLDQHRPLIRASVFVGQADSKRAEGMKQAQQIETIERFKKGDFNVLVATSIGEEGLDIGQVDLIICYDASASPIRMLQRMGRTGRKRAGNIIMLLMRGKEEEQFAKSKDSYGKMQALICEGSRFNFRFDLSARIVPRTCQPVVDKRQIQIPIENTQDSSLPEPRTKRVGARRKLPPKKFHMPDGVETGFRKVTHFMKPFGKRSHVEATRQIELEELTAIPDLDHVTLSQDHQEELDKNYRDLPFTHGAIQEAEMPSLTAHMKAQRHLLPIGRIAHGSCTRRFVKVFGIMGSGPAAVEEPCGDTSKGHFLDIPVKPFVNSDGEEEKDPSLLRETCSSKLSMAGHHRPPQAATRHQRERRTVVSGLAQASKTGGTETLQDQPNEKQKAETISFYERSEKRSRQERSRKPCATSADQSSGEVGYVGDDCDRDSDIHSRNSEGEGSLLDFIAADSETVSSIEGSQPLPDSPGGSLGGQAEDRFFVPTCFPATQESEDFPELPTLLGKRKGQKLEALKVGYTKDGWATSTTAPRKRARWQRQIVKSDEE